MRVKTKNSLIWLQIAFIYLLIFFEYPFGMAFSQLVFHRPLATSIEPVYLLVWGLIRIALILPMTFSVITNLGYQEKKPLMFLGDYRRGTAATFWGTFFFVIVGTIFYQYFLKPTNLTLLSILLNIPLFLSFAVSNAFVEETFFRGLLLQKILSRSHFWLANTLQALLFAAIHVVNPMSQATLLFVGLTFVLGIIWGLVTNKYQSLVPAIAMHLIADIFVAISLF